ncbi:hypothetical protein GCM10027093_43770 [Paraburkholderia jirisanensis]
MLSKRSAADSVDPTLIELSILSTESSLQAGNPACVYSNGVMTAKIWLGWVYNDKDSTLNTSDIESYLQTQQNLTWGYIDSANTAGGSLDELGWTVSTTDNGFDHDYSTAVTIEPSTTPTSDNLQGSIPYYVLPNYNASDGRNIYCYLTQCNDDPTNVETYNKYYSTLKQQFPCSVTCKPWIFYVDDFEFRNIPQDDDNSMMLKQICYKSDPTSTGPTFILRKWTDFRPRTNYYDEPYSYLPFDCGYDGQLFAIVYSGNDSNWNNNNTIFLIQKNETLAKELATSRTFKSRDLYYYNYSNQSGTVFYECSNCMYNTGMPHNYKWDDELPGVLIGGCLYKYIECTENGNVKIQVNSYPNEPKYHFYANAQDNFGTNVEFGLQLVTQKWQCPEIDSVSSVQPT